MLEIEEKVDALIKEEKFVDAMSSLANLRQPVDSFFDSVTVNVDDTSIRHNRLRLLTYIQQVIDNVANFSKIEG